MSKKLQSELLKVRDHCENCCLFMELNSSFRNMCGVWAAFKVTHGNVRNVVFVNRIEVHKG
jgi:hypothetical protein